MNIGITIKKFRHQQDLTQEQLAEYINVSVSAVSQWESGKTVPDVTTVLALANFLIFLWMNYLIALPRIKRKS